MKKSSIGDILKGLIGKNDKTSIREKEIIQLAQKKGGRLSILEIVAETSMSTAEADAIMTEMTTKGYVYMNVTESGAIIYEFPGILERAQTEKQDLFHRELTRGASGSSRDLEQPEVKPPPLPPRRKEKRRTPPPPPKPKVKPKVEAHNFTFELERCHRSGKNVICDILIKSTKHNKKLAIRPGAEVFDETAKTYPARVQVVSGDVRDAIDYLWLSCKPHTPLKVSVSAKIPSWQVKMIAILEIQCKDDILGPAFNVQFHDIPLGG